MEKLKKILFNIVFYITVIAIIIAVFLLMVIVVMKLNVYALTGAGAEPVCILIDPGHGAEDGGAVGDSGLVEKDVNLEISLTLKDMLEMSGCRVLMTRSDDSILGSGSTLKERLHDDFAKRLELYNSDDVDIVVSIHQNKFTSSGEHGAQIFYSPNDPLSEDLADCTRRAFIGLLQPDNERAAVKAGSNIYLLNNCTKPCILAECGFLSNPEEEALLSDEEYCRQVAFTVCCGITEFISTATRR